MEDNMNNDCIFCKLANGVFETNTIYEDELVRVILDASPATYGHALVLPKEHYRNLFDLDEKYASHVLVVAKKIANVMKDVLGCTGLNIMQNNEAVAGQTVFHFHLHIIPRYDDDNLNLTFNDPAPIDAAIAKELCAKLSNAIN